MADDYRTDAQQRAAERGQKDGLPAQIHRSLAIGGLHAILGRYRPNRVENLRPEQMDMLAMDERGRVETAPDRPVAAILEDILMKLTEINETLLERLE